MFLTLVLFPFSDEYFWDYSGASTRSAIWYCSAKLVRTNNKWNQIPSNRATLLATQKRPLHHKCQGKCYFPFNLVQAKITSIVITKFPRFCKDWKDFSSSLLPSLSICMNTMEIPEIFTLFWSQKLIKYFHMIFQHKKMEQSCLWYMSYFFDHTIYCKGCHQTSSIFCNSNLSKKKKCESLPIEQKKFTPPSKKKMIAAARPPTVLW